MLRNEKVSLDGKHYQVSDAINSPAPLSKIPIMIGGSGEKKTLRMVAEYADESNLVGTAAADIPHKLAALDEHCERLGRNRSEIDVTCLQMVVIAPTMEEAEADMREIAAVKGWNDEIMEMARSILVFGDADAVGEQLQAVMDAGLVAISGLVDRSKEMRSSQASSAAPWQAWISARFERMWALSTSLVQSASALR